MYVKKLVTTIVDNEVDVVVVGTTLGTVVTRVMVVMLVLVEFWYIEETVEDMTGLRMIDELRDVDVDVIVSVADAFKVTVET